MKIEAKSPHSSAVGALLFQKKLLFEKSDMILFLY